MEVKLENQFFLERKIYKHWNRVHQRTYIVFRGETGFLLVVS